MFMMMVLGIIFSAYSSYQYRTLEEIFEHYVIDWSEKEKDQFSRYFIRYDSLIEADAEQALDVCRKGLKDKSLVNVSHIIHYMEVKALSALGKFDSASIRIHELNISSLPIDSFLGDYYILLGRLAKLNGNYTKAIDYYEQAIDIFKQLGDYKGIAITQINIVEYYRSIGSFESAFYILNKCKEVMNAHQITGEVYQYYLNRASAVYNETDQLEKAYETVMLSIKFLKGTKNVFQLASAYNENASILNKINRKDSVEYYLSKAIDLWKKGGYSRFWVSASGNLISFMMENEKWEKVEPLLNETLPIARNYEWNAVLYTLYSQKSELLKHQGDVSGALVYKDSSYQSYIQDLRRSVNKEVAVKQSQLEAERQQLELEFEKNRVTNLKREKNVILLTGMAITIMFLAILWLYKNEKRTKKKFIASNIQLNETLQLNHSLLKDVHHRVKNNLAMLTGLVHHESKSAPKEANASFERMRERLEAIAVVHSRLMDYSKEAKSNMVEVIQDLRNLILVNSDLPIEVVLNSNKKYSGIEANKAILLGIIMNELLTNSVKHALRKESNNRIEIDYCDANDHIIIKYCDRSSGLYETKNNAGAGVQLIDKMLEQLNGTLTRESDSLWSTLRIPK